MRQRSVSVRGPPWPPPWPPHSKQCLLFLLLLFTLRGRLARFRSRGAHMAGSARPAFRWDGAWLGGSCGRDRRAPSAERGRALRGGGGGGCVSATTWPRSRGLAVSRSRGLAVGVAAAVDDRDNVILAVKDRCESEEERREKRERERERHTEREREREREKRGEKEKGAETRTAHRERSRKALPEKDAPPKERVLKQSSACVDAALRRDRRAARRGDATPPCVPRRARARVRAWAGGRTRAVRARASPIARASVRPVAS